LIQHFDYKQNTSFFYFYFTFLSIIISGLFGAIFARYLVLQYKVDPVQEFSGNPYDCFVLFHPSAIADILHM